MASLNKWIGIGNLGRDPEIRYTANGDAIANFSIACTENWKDKATGEKREMTEWVRITAFGRTAEICGQYLKKGSQVYIEGSLRTRKWTDKDGIERYTTEIRCDDMKMLGNPRGDRPSADDSGGPPPDRRAPPAHGNQGGGYGNSGPRPNYDSLGEDDIPFSPAGTRGPLGHVFTD